ncbi:MAG: 4Fe-4S binding protein [Candidatus Thorarchaeota archaeon]|nr:4Fe-4S binding protein [Candidatus Thorarchaeota archaeon]
MSGNEAIARGALEARVGFCASYPGTPSTEIAATLMRLPAEHGVYVEWSVNEKVALEAAAGASWLGVPALCSMKSLGLNVAADFLLNINLSGSGQGGLVVVVCDDPRGHSSSNEQDSRFYARAASLPLLEPMDCQQAKDVVRYAFDLSRRIETPVLVRSTTRLSHSRGVVITDTIPERAWTVKQELPGHLYNVPDPHLKHRDLLVKMKGVMQEFEVSQFNRLKQSSGADVTLISSGVCSYYASEAMETFPTKSFAHLALATTHPLPEDLIRRTLEESKRVVFVEETDPFVEEGVRSLSTRLGIQTRFYGKASDDIPGWGEMDVSTVRSVVARTLGVESPRRPREIEEAAQRARRLLVNRRMTFCAGCTHRNVYWAIRRLRRKTPERFIVAGDIGCYSLGVFYDTAMETMQAMGSGIGTASGMGQLWRHGLHSKVIAVAGDSTFFHACIPGLINARHHGADIVFMVLDNQTTAMTGFQQHAGMPSEDNHHHQLRLDSLIMAIEPDLFLTVDSTSIRQVEEALKKALDTRGLRVLLLHGVCRLDEKRRMESERTGNRKITIDCDKCRGDKCRVCAGQYQCTAIGWDRASSRPFIIQESCVRCGSCIEVCPSEAIGWSE